MPADLLPFQQAILRICSEEGEFYGVGCRLKPDQAITCAHVVADALGYDRDIDSIPRGKVQINCPFDNTRSVTAQVKAWFPRDGHPLSDMALLQLDEPLTESIAIKLSYAVNLNGVCFKAWGGPEGHKIHLIDIEGIIGEKIGNGRYRLDVSGSNYKIEQGCSGAPVVDVATGQILGLIAQEELDKDIPAGFLIPAAHWRQTGWFPEPNAGIALEPLKTWIKNHYNRRYRERQRIENFVAYYAGTPAELMPFAGREEWLQQLDQWLAQDQSRFLLLSGSAGRGKSALLLHWLARIISQQPTLTLLFLPISIRFETSNELEGLRLLHAALCDYFADLVFSPHDKPDINDYRDRLFDGWERLVNQPNQRYLLVIDGIDESANHWLLKEVLPRELPTNWHLLLSARHRPGETDGTTWLSDLGLTGELLELPPLTQSAIAEAIIQLGRPLDELAEQQAFVEQLYRLTDQGDPLLLTLWIRQIWQHREAAPQITVDKLRQLEPNFAGFYQIWLAEQQKIWQAKSIDIHPSDFNRLMQVLASAYGPLLLEDELVDLLKQISLPVSWDYIKLRDVLTTASRLVVGDGETQGFSLIHPRLNDYFQAELAKNLTHQRQVQEAYLNWGAAVVTRLNQNQLMPDSCPHYLLEHYTDHIAAAHLEPNFALENYWLPLLEGGWHQAWEAYEGAWNGFLSDLERVLEVLRQYNQACYECGELRAMKLASEVRCALIWASIYKLIQNLSVELLIELVKSGLWSLKRGMRIAESYEQPEKRVEFLTQIAKLASPKETRALLQKALQITTMIEGNLKQAKAFFNIAEQLQGEEQQSVLQQTLECIIQSKIKTNHFLTVISWFEVLYTLAEQLQGWKKQSALWLGIEIIEKWHWLLNPLIIEKLVTLAEQQQWDEKKRTKILQIRENSKKFVEKYLKSASGWRIIKKPFSDEDKQLQDKEKKENLQQALIAEKRIGDEWSRINALITVAKQLQNKKKSDILQEILKEINIIKGNQRERSLVLIEIAKQLTENKEKFLQQAIEYLKEIKDDKNYISTSIAIAEQLPSGEKKKEILQQALRTSKNIKNDKDRISTLIAIAKQLQDKEKEKILGECLEESTKMIEDEGWYSDTLIDIAEQLPDEEKQLILRQAIEVVKSNYHRSIILLNVMEQQLWNEEKLATIQQFLELAKTMRCWDFEFDMIMFYFLIYVNEPLPDKEKQVVLQQTVKIIKERYGIDEVIIAQLQKKSTLQKACFDNALRLCLSIKKYPNYSNFKICFKIIIARLQDLNPNLLTYDLWTNCLEPLFPDRSELFEIIGELCTATIQLTGNPQEADEIARAVMDVAKWWP